MTEVDLQDLGWDSAWNDEFEPYNLEGLVPARVAVRHHGPCVLMTAQGELGGVPAGRLGEEDLPAVGDWVAVRPLPGERKAVIQAVLPRRSAFLRKEAWRRATVQVVAANVDVVFLVSSFGPDLNPRRLERYLTAAWESGAQPVLVLTKADLADDPVEEAAPVEAIAYGVAVHTVSNVSGEGLDALEAYLVRGRTIALLGSSGVGKSTLVNRLLGRKALATQEVRSDGRGRHTTTHRELVRLPGGALLLDTPGMRELQLWESDTGLETTFEDVGALASECRFADCAHEGEPGCAVMEAIRRGTLPAERFTSYKKLQRELRALEVRLDKRLVSEERKKRRRQERGRRKVSY